MSDKLIITNYLLVLKSTVEVFIHGTLESSNVEIRECLKDGLDSILTSQADTYDFMTKLGYYSVNNIDNSEISCVLDKVTGEN